MFGIICIQRKTLEGRWEGFLGWRFEKSPPQGNQKTLEGSQKPRTGGSWLPFPQPTLASVYRSQPDGPAASHQHQSQILEHFSEWHQLFQALQEPGTSSQPCGPLSWRAEQDQKQSQLWSPESCSQRSPATQPKPSSVHSDPGPARYLPLSTLHSLSRSTS